MFLIGTLLKTITRTAYMGPAGGILSLTFWALKWVKRYFVFLAVVSTAMSVVAILATRTFLDEWRRENIREATQTLGQPAVSDPEESKPETARSRGGEETGDPGTSFPDDASGS